ncbi:Acyl-dehydrogenase family member 11 [Hyphodiscus hymeniophilus]|uniref:Acyl-dehydrogenase family member 11 n=1 Tax=Hyphodiscus hymeniophilus TaxID=353542 RepID=A0A9P6VE31_9HELO|nr:Acyl-dehydrogenase family member 11 [Hyphodiscus hymeniophilus]
MSSEIKNADSLAQDRVPSSASSGIFMQSPVLGNQYYADSSLNRVKGLFLPDEIAEDTSKDLSRFGSDVISQKVFNLVSDAERNVPYVRGSGRDAFGRRTDELVTSEGWRNLQSIGLKEGIVAIAYENKYADYSRVVQFMKYHLWTGSCAIVTCPSAMQDGAASLISRHLNQITPHKSPLTPTSRNVLEKAFKNLTARDENAWTSGQWMTERVGGSDVSGTETLATYAPLSSSGSFEPTQIDGSPLGPWRVDGFKWFSSATDSQMTIALAQSPTGLSAFYIPMRRVTLSGETELNGIRISRLKNKMGTKALPTAELEMVGARAFLLGKEGDGVREISTILNITRVHTAITSLGLFGRGLAIAKAFAEVRDLAGKGKKKTLKDVPLHVHTLAATTLSYRSNMLFGFFVVYCLGMADQLPSWSTSQKSFASARLRPQTQEDLQLLLRVLTPVLKAMTAKASISGLQECMEALGGVGYLENEESQHINVARLYRDVNVLSIWEGTTNVLGNDLIRTLKGRNGPRTLKSIRTWLKHALLGSSPGDTTHFEAEKTLIVDALDNFESEILGKDLEELLLRARRLMERLSEIVKCTLMIIDAERDQDAVSIEMLKRYACAHDFGGPYKCDWKTEAIWDSRIVFGEAAGKSTTRARL